MPMYDYICEVCGRPGREWRPEGHPPRFCSREHMTAGMAGVPRKPRKYIITPELHERIKKIYHRDTGNGQVAALARAVDLPRWRITRYAINQGWIAKQQKEPYWTEEETGLLQKLARYSPDVIQRRLRLHGYRRSVTGIVLKMKRMNMRQNLAGHSSRDVARCLGVDDHFVTRAIALGKLKATRRGTARTKQQGGDIYWIRDEAIRKYILEYLNEIDIRKVDKYWFVDMIAPQNSRGLYAA